MVYYYLHPRQDIAVEPPESADYWTMMVLAGVATGNRMRSDRLTNRQLPVIAGSTKQIRTY